MSFLHWFDCVSFALTWNLTLEFFFIRTVGGSQTLKGVGESIKSIYSFNEMKIVQVCSGHCKPTKWGLGWSSRVFTIFSHYLILRELPVERSNIGKISPNKTTHHLPLSKWKKGHIKVAESYWEEQLFPSLFP